jgi:hypothetical protein
LSEGQHARVLQLPVQNVAGHVEKAVTPAADSRVRAPAG